MPPEKRAPEFQDRSSILNPNNKNQQHRPNPTKHQQKMFGIPATKDYKSKKEVLPEAHSPNVKVDEDWDEMTTHSSPEGREDLSRMNKEFSLEELNRVINKMKRKAPGHDGILIDQFKVLTIGAKLKLLDIYNEIWEQGIFPETWKQAIMIPILKKGKPAKAPESYRPISLLPVGAKIMEGLVFNRINPYMEKRGLIPCVQTGFRKGKNTSINLIRTFTHSYSKAIRVAFPTTSILTFFDAFDSVWHTGLLHKCMKDGLPAVFTRFLRTWLDNRTLRVRLGQTLSREDSWNQESLKARS